MNIDAPISLGELFDKISVLEVKLHKIPINSKKKYIKIEYDLLKALALPYLSKSEELGEYLSNLEGVNSKIWDILERQREKDSLLEFDDEFVSLSREVYIQNDLRFKYKDLINKKMNSTIQEQKFYSTS